MTFADRLRQATKPVGGHSTEQRSPGVSVDAVDPIPEHHSGDLIPYRGTEQHGVHTDNHITHVDSVREPLRRNVDVAIVHGTEPHVPILVKVVQEEGDEVRDWRALTTVVDGTSRLILTRMPTRTVSRITNEGTAVIRIGCDQAINTMNSFPIAPGATLTDFRATEEVFGISVDGSSVSVSALIEFRR